MLKSFEIEELNSDLFCEIKEKVEQNFNLVFHVFNHKSTLVGHFILQIFYSVDLKGKQIEKGRQKRTLFMIDCWLDKWNFMINKLADLKVFQIS